MKEIAGEEGGQQETLDGVRVVPVDMVGMPAFDQFVEPMILDVPIADDRNRRPARWRRVGPER